jgi:hypothetical protein
VQQPCQIPGTCSAKAKLHAVAIAEQDTDAHADPNSIAVDTTTVPLHPSTNHVSVMRHQGKRESHRGHAPAGATEHLAFDGTCPEPDGVFDAFGRTPISHSQWLQWWSFHAPIVGSSR